MLNLPLSSQINSQAPGVVRGTFVPASRQTSLRVLFFTLLLTPILLSSCSKQNIPPIYRDSPLSAHMFALSARDISFIQVDSGRVPKEMLETLLFDYSRGSGMVSNSSAASGVLPFFQQILLLLSEEFSAPVLFAETILHRNLLSHKLRDLGFSIDVMDPGSGLATRWRRTLDDGKVQVIHRIAQYVYMISSAEDVSAAENMLNDVLSSGFPGAGGFPPNPEWLPGDAYLVSAIQARALSIAQSDRERLQGLVMAWSGIEPSGGGQSSFSAALLCREESSARAIRSFLRLALLRELEKSYPNTEKTELRPQITVEQEGKWLYIYSYPIPYSRYSELVLSLGLR